MIIPRSLERSLDVWGKGQLMAFSAIDGRTDFHDGLVARTGGPSAAIHIMWPAGADIVFSNAPPLRSFVTSDVLAVETPEGAVTAAFLDAHHLLIEGPCRVRCNDPLLCVSSIGTRTLIAARRYAHLPHIHADIQDAVAKRLAWLAGRMIPTSLSPATRRTLIKSLSVMKSQVCSPEGAIRHRWTTPDRWPHRKMWLWDSAFHAIGWRHVDNALARDMLEAVLDCQFPDGRVAISVSPFDPDTSGKTQPPVLALAAWLIDQAAPDSSWIEHIYPSLCRYIEWDLANRDTDCSGLLEWAIDQKVSCRCGESGADNSSRFDSGQSLHVPDFNALAALECELLERMARRLKRPEEECRVWGERRSRICRRMNERLWSKSFGLYMDVPVGRKESTEVMSCAGFLPLICMAPSGKQIEQLVKHLRNPETFGTAFPVPSIAPRTSPHYRKDMWRGPVWINIDWLIWLGLRRNGLAETATALRAAAMSEIERQYEKHGVTFEFYDDENVVDPPRLDRKGPCNPGEWLHQVVHDYGWTATCYVDWALSDAGL